MLCQRPSGQRSQNYLLSHPSEKKMCCTCSGYFLPDKIYFVPSRQQRCSCSQITLIQWGDWDALKVGISDCKSQVIHFLLLVCHPYGIPIQNRFTRLALLWQAKDSSFCPSLSRRLSDSCFSASQLHFLQFADTWWGKLTQISDSLLWVVFSPNLGPIIFHALLASQCLHVDFYFK